MTSQEKDLLLQKIKGLNNTTISDINYVKSEKTLLEQHQMKCDGMLLHLYTQQKEIVEIFQLVKAMSVEEEDEVN